MLPRQSRITDVHGIRDPDGIVYHLQKFSAVGRIFSVAATLILVQQRFHRLVALGRHWCVSLLTYRWRDVKAGV